MEQQTLNFIDKLIELESNKKDKLYNNVYDKYLNGHCEDLVTFLRLYNDCGEKIELKNVTINENDEEEISFHYIYKLNDKYFDINGSFNSLDSLVEEIGYVDYIKSFKVNDFSSNLDKLVLDKMKDNDLYLSIINELNFKNELDR